MQRVIHLPGRTPYARKLQSDQIVVLNDSTIDGLVVPRDATLTWLLQHRPWSWLDVVHLHHIEFEPIALQRELLRECRRSGTQVVFTAHDVTPIFISPKEYQERVRLLVRADVPFVCLTPAAEQAVHLGFEAHRSSLVPHGYVMPPGHATTRVAATGPTRFLLFGSLRTNRDVELALHCWRFARDLRDSTLTLQLRAPSRASLAEEAAAWQAIGQHSSDPRLTINVLPFPSDEDVATALSESDCLLLPYRWASHSGQLEAAFDAGVLPVASRVGCLPDQVALHGDLVDEPIWFDWSDGATFSYGTRLLSAMERAQAMIQSGWQAPNLVDFAAYRQAEHADVLAGYAAVYGAAGGSDV